MKHCTLILLTISPLLFHSSAFAQGSLTPPGAPAPTMKTLSQIESRTIIDPSAPGFTTPYVITQPGSYYLAGNITISNGSDGIRIESDNVTVDLNGFSLISTSNPASGNAISLFFGTYTNIAIRNGNIRGQVTFGTSTFSGPGFSAGISVIGPGTGSSNVRVSDLSIAGCSSDGIQLLDSLGSPGLVERCTVSNVGGSGITASNVSHCNVFLTGSGISSTNCSDSYASAVGSGIAISATNVSNSSGYGSNGKGISATNVENSYGSSGAGDGIHASTASHCTGSSTSGDGVYVDNVATGCSGNSTNSYGVFSNHTATGCTGTSVNLVGVQANGAAENCTGTSNGNQTGLFAQAATNCTGTSAGAGIGLQVASCATGCYGSSNSGTGLQAEMAINCHGVTATGTGLKANSTATGCYGFATGAGTGLNAFIANVCHGVNNNGGGVSIVTTHNINSF